MFRKEGENCIQPEIAFNKESFAYVATLIADCGIKRVRSAINSGTYNIENFESDIELLGTLGKKYVGKIENWPPRSNMFLTRES